MRKWWQIAVIFVVTFTLLIGGGVLAGYNDILGFALMLTGLFIIWTWSLWPDIRNWFMSRKKGH
jgi:hypothetical protein